MVDAVLSGKEVPVKDTKTYNNGVKAVPSSLKPSWLQEQLGEGADRQRLLQRSQFE